MLTQLRTLVSLTFVSLVLAAPAPRGSPTVTLDNGTFVGAVDGNTYKFLGIPFAKPPTGDLRFRLPVPNDPYTGTHTATSFGQACPQQAVKFNLPVAVASDVVNEVINDVYNAVIPSGEDCLTVNVWRPTNIPSGTKLPVAVWIFGGGFEFGAPSEYEGGLVVSHSISMGQPIVYVSINYRVSAFGFLASQEVKDAGVGNLGLQDQRQALRWVQKYISAFGGDPTKVTIWGESAGAISVALHMVANNGNNEGLFRGGFSESGATIPVGDITHGQGDYDNLVQRTGCQGSSDTLQCLREAPFNTLMAAVNQSPILTGPSSLHLAWLPRADGVFLTDTPQNLVQKGAVANIPFVNGNNDDEGTLFALSLLNITTDDEVRDYIKATYIPGISDSQMDQLLQLYPSDLSAGSPYDTGVLNALSPQYKRLASFQGDLTFQAPRRFFVQARGDKQPVWSYLNKRLKSIPFLGSFHATDILNVYGGGDIADFLVNFVNKLDPNGPTVPHWPKYTASSPQLMTLVDGVLDTSEISTDNYRQEQMAYLQQLSLQYPI